MGGVRGWERAPEQDAWRHLWSSSALSRLIIRSDVFALWCTQRVNLSRFVVDQNTMRPNLIEEFETRRQVLRDVVRAGQSDQAGVLPLWLS